ncbi:hypothetical protein HMPREF9413_2539 [Paenibacillus sp. HGF7]|nr:hypothetical protein HMPREF9413_2539 [Paenibacillus sp. HGF7]
MCPETSAVILLRYRTGSFPYSPSFYCRGCGKEIQSARQGNSPLRTLVIT